MTYKVVFIYLFINTFAWSCCVLLFALLAGPATSPPDVSQIGAKPATALLLLQQHQQQAQYRGVNPYKSAVMAEPKSSSSPVSSVSSAEQILRQIKQHRQLQQEQDLHEFAQSLVEDLQPVNVPSSLTRGGSGGSADGRTKYLQYQQQVAQQQMQQQQLMNQSKNDKNSKARNNRRLGRHESRYTSGNYTKT